MTTQECIRARASTLAALALACTSPGPVAAAAAGSVPDFTISILLKEGDELPGHGVLGTPFADIAVNNDGEWIIEATIDGQRTLVRNGAGVLAAGDPVEPAPSTVGAFTPPKSLNNTGDVGMRLTLDGGPADDAMYFNDAPVLLQNDISTAPQFTPGTPYTQFFRWRLNDQNQLLLVANVNDEGLPGTVHRALVWIEYDPETGGFTEDVLFKRHDPAPGLEDLEATLDQFGTAPQEFAINNNRDALFGVLLGNVPFTVNGAIYLNDKLIAQKGGPTPYSGAYGTDIGAAARVDLNNRGEFVFRGNHAGPDAATDRFIVRNGDEPFIRVGDPVPGYEEETLTGLGNGPVRIDDQGRVIWFGAFTGDESLGQGLFIDQTMILQKGLTTVDGHLITTVAGTSATGGITKGFVNSDDGRYIIVRAVLDGLTQAVLLIEFEDGPEECPAGDINCDGAVDVDDLLILLAAWGECDEPGDCPADLNGDGVIDVDDLLILLANWG